MSLAHVTIKIATLPQEAAIQDVTTTWTSLPTMWWQCWDRQWQHTLPLIRKAPQKKNKNRKPIKRLKAGLIENLKDENPRA
jgi:uncharacterized membrane-anchored protein